ncbi:MAG TPA: hypothetical protein EYN70_11010 [Planctomycetaceae bacterium]|nr:hypothetical protein [Planctomycetaceae bacterium]
MLVIVNPPYEHLPRLSVTLAVLWGTLFLGSIALAQRPSPQGVASDDQPFSSHPLRFFQMAGKTSASPVPATETDDASAATLVIQGPSQGSDAGSRRRSLSAPRSSTQAITTVLSALAIVLGVFFLVVWITRSANKRRWLPLPDEAVQLLGRAPLAGRQWMQLIRVGNKLVMVSVNSNQVDTLTEITNPEEVERLVAVCHKSQPNSIRQTFQQVLNRTSQGGSDRGSYASIQSHQTSSLLDNK